MSITETHSVHSSATVARERPLEGLEAEIVTLSSQLTAASARLLALVGDFDAAEGWREWGMRSTAQWLSWKCGLSLVAGREQVRVAGALRGLPLIAGFAAGRLSYSKVRALTRLATVDNEAELADLAVSATAAQLDRMLAGWRRGRRAADVRERRAAERVSLRQVEDGSLVGSLRLNPERGATVAAALEAVPGMSAADALVAMSEAWPFSVRASAEAPESVDSPPPAPERVQLVLHTSLDALATPDDGDDEGTASMLDTPTGRISVRLHPATARRLACDCPATTVVTDPDGRDVLHVGRRSRRITGRLRRGVWLRDRGRCRAPGCDQAAVTVHHVRHWANGGPTCLANLISLCAHHHWLVHEGGWTLVPTSNGRDWLLLGPTGVIVDPHSQPTAAADPLPHHRDLAADAVTGNWAGDRMQLTDTIGWLTQHDGPDHDRDDDSQEVDQDASAEAPEPVDSEPLPATRADSSQPAFRFTAEHIERYCANIDAMNARTPTYVFDLDVWDRGDRG